MISWHADYRAVRTRTLPPAAARSGRSCSHIQELPAHCTMCLCRFNKQCVWNASRWNTRRGHRPAVVLPARRCGLDCGSTGGCNALPVLLCVVTTHRDLEIAHLLHAGQYPATLAC